MLSNKKNSKRYADLLGRGVKNCSSTALDYSNCVIDNLSKLKKGVCDEQFKHLQKCMKDAVTSY